MIGKPKANKTAMSASNDRFISKGNFIKSPSSGIKWMSFFNLNLKNFEAAFELEKKKAPKLAKAWIKAEKQYASYVEKLSPKENNMIVKQLPKKLPESLKTKADLVLKAMLVCTMNENGFIEKFNKVTNNFLSKEFGKEDWQKYKFKCFFMLVHFAVKFLPFHLKPEAKSVVFRGMEKETPLKVGDIFATGELASFTALRKVALGKKISKEDKQSTSLDVETVAPPPKLLLRLSVADDSDLKALCVSHQSSSGDKELLVSPLQKFKVKKVVKKEAKGFNVVFIQPVK